MREATWSAVTLFDEEQVARYHPDSCGKPTRANWLLEKAAAKGHTGAQHYLRMYGNTPPATPQELFALLQNKARADDGWAILGLSMCYLAGCGVARDEARHILMLHDAARLGVDEAQSLLGQNYHLGLRLRMNADEARKWAELAAAQNHPKGQFYLAMCIARSDPQRSAQLVRASAASGYGSALMYLARECARAQDWYNTILNVSMAVDQGKMLDHALLGNAVYEMYTRLYVLAYIRAGDKSPDLMWKMYSLGKAMDKCWLLGNENTAVFITLYRRWTYNARRATHTWLWAWQCKFRRQLPRDVALIIARKLWAEVNRPC